MTARAITFVREQPSFEDITLYQLCYWKGTRIYGLTPEEIEDLLTNPDPHIPSHHQIDPRIIKAYLTGESVPTYLPGYWLSRHSKILPAYLPRDRFLPSELAVPLVDAHYPQDYLIWKQRLDANIRATHYLFDHLRDPSGTVPYCESIEDPVSIPFVPTVRAAELRWWHRYLITYHSFNDLTLRRGHYRNSLIYDISTVSWHTGKSAQDIYTTALTILQVGQLAIRLPPNPDFNSLSPEEKDRIYQSLHDRLINLVPQKQSATYKALSWGDPGPALEASLAIQKFVIAFVCRFQVILLHGFKNFPTIDDLRQILLDQYERIGLECGYIETLRPDHPYRTVREGSSWEGGGPIQLPCISLDSTIADNYRRYRNSSGIETDSVRNPPRPAKRSRIQSDSDDLFGDDSELSESSEDI
jgi:hypothetical protein